MLFSSFGVYFGNMCVPATGCFCLCGCCCRCFLCQPKLFMALACPETATIATTATTAATLTQFFATGNFNHKLNSHIFCCCPCRHPPPATLPTTWPWGKAWKIAVIIGVIIARVALQVCSCNFVNLICRLQLATFSLLRFG